MDSNCDIDKPTSINNTEQIINTNQLDSMTSSINQEPDRNDMDHNQHTANLPSQIITVARSSAIKNEHTDVNIGNNINDDHNYHLHINSSSDINNGRKSSNNNVDPNNTNTNINNNNNSSSSNPHKKDNIINETRIKTKHIQKWPHTSQMFFYFNFSAYSILGFLLRYYLSELFNSGCDDVFATTHYSLLCVTSSETALFMDLPANILGCFILGFMSTSAKIIIPNDSNNQPNNNNNAISQSKIIPWLHSEHYFQNWEEVHLAIRTAFCGSLTTFASWNAQMVKMICTWNISSIVLALYGYILGVQATYMSLKFGQNVSFWIYSWKERKRDALQKKIQKSKEEIVIIQHLQDELRSYKSEEEDLEEIPTSKAEYLHLLLPFLVVIPLLIYFIYQGEHEPTKSSISQRNAYREIWLSCLLAPIGAILRYRLSLSLNDTLPWIPLGTLVANITGSIIAVITVSFLLLIQVENWSQDVLFAIKLGFAGCLSTVSTFIDEFDILLLKYPRQAKAYTYIYGSLCVAGLLGICIYAPVSYATSLINSSRVNGT